MLFTGITPAMTRGSPMPGICEGPGQVGLVTVIIPTYNRAYIIGKTIDSVLAQTYRPIEIIVIDDGSTDDTRRVVTSYGDSVRYVHQANTGVPGARNAGFALARGDFLALVDSDDCWHPWKLELQVEFMRRHPDVGMVWTDMAAVGPDGRRIADTYLRTFYKAYEKVQIEDIMSPAGKIGDLGVAVPQKYASRPMWVGDIFSQLIRGTLVHTPTTMLRRERVRGTGGYNEALRPTGEDFDFHLRTASLGRVGFLDVPTIDYRVGSEDQLTAPSYALAMARNYLRTIDYWMDRGRDRISLPDSELRSIRAYAHEWVGAQELIGGSRAAARHHLWRSVREVPTRPATVALLALALLPPQVFTAVRSLRHLRS